MNILTNLKKETTEDIVINCDKCDKTFNINDNEIQVLGDSIFEEIFVCNKCIKK